MPVYFSLCEMGCGSTKLNSSAHVASSPDHGAKYSSKQHRHLSNTGMIQEVEEMTVSSATSSGQVAYKSRQNTVCNDGPIHCYSRATGIKGNATFTVTLSNDGSLLEIETVTMGADETSSLYSEYDASGPCFESTGEMTTIAEISSMPATMSDIRSVKGDERSFVKVNGKTSTPYTSVHCLDTEPEFCHQHTDGATIDLENDSTCYCAGNAKHKCQTFKVNHCTSLPDIKIQEKYFKQETQQAVALADMSGFHSNYSRESSPVSQCGYLINGEHNDRNPGGESTPNCPSNSGSLSEGSNHLGNCNLQSTPLNQAIANDRLHSNTNQSPCVKNKIADSKYREGTSSGNVTQGSSGTMDYTCLDYCARKCYNNPSVPRLSSRTLKTDVNDSPRPMVASFSFCEESKNTPQEITMVSSASESTSRGENLGIALQDSASSTISSAYKRNSGSAKKKSKQKQSKSQLHDSPQSGVFGISSSNALSAFLSRSFSSPRHQSPTHSTNTCSLTPKAKNKSCLRLLKCKALSEDVPGVLRSDHYVRQSTSFDGHPTVSDGHNNSSTSDEKTPPQSDRTDCDVSYVHQDFFNDFEDLNDEES